MKAQLNREDVSEIVIATDAGREGELVARWIIEKAHVKKPIKRLWISSSTDKAIKEGFEKLKDGRQYNNLYYSAIARAEADWFVGINGTRALTTKYNAQLSCGRVQTPTLGMILKREEEIRKFVPKEYYSIEISTKKGSSNFKMNWVDKNNNTTSFNEEKIENTAKKLNNKEIKITDVKKVDKKRYSKPLYDLTELQRDANKRFGFSAKETLSIMQKLYEHHKVLTYPRTDSRYLTTENTAKKLNNKEIKITDVKKVDKKRYSKPLYDLTELQRDANKRFGFSAKETLSIMQKLYEHHKVLTYPRTDSRYLTTDIVETLKDRVKAVNVSDYSKVCNKLLKTNIKGNKSFVDNSKVSDHHAIIPTEERVFLGDLSDKERKIYDLVVKRFLSVLCPPFEYVETTITGQCEGENFRVKGNKVVNLGFTEAYGDDEDEKLNTIPEILVNDVLKIEEVKVKTGKTNPPPYLNEATLLTEMEKNNLGTVATRADIIEKLFNSFSVEKKNNKELHITSKGRQLLDLAPEKLKTPSLTAEWEKKLTDISNGKANKDAFIEDIKSYTKEIVKEINRSDSKFKHDNLTKNKCPNCGKFMLEVNGQKGKMLVCEDRECNTRKTVSQITNSRCPNCHKKLELRGEGENKIFACACGYREKLSAFNKRKAEEKQKGSKKDIQKYLKNQNKNEEIFNNPFAEALAKLKK